MFHGIIMGKYRNTRDRKSNKLKNSTKRWLTKSGPEFSH
jgi:hypothetical protein